MSLQLGLAAALATAIASSSMPARAAGGPRLQPTDSAQARADAALRDQGVVVTDEHPSVMGIVARNTLAGALAGGLIGTAVWLLDTPRHDAERIAYWAAGGAVVGAAVGVIQALADAGQGKADLAPARAPGALLVPAWRLKL